MVAVPKNQALTMLLSGGTVGFDATSASFENGQIVLSSGAASGPACRDHHQRRSLYLDRDRDRHRRRRSERRRRDT